MLKRIFEYFFGDEKNYLSYEIKVESPDFYTTQFTEDSFEAHDIREGRRN